MGKGGQILLYSQFAQGGQIENQSVKAPTAVDPCFAFNATLSDTTSADAGLIIAEELVFV